MRNVRLDGALETRILKAAGVTGEPVALFIHRALEDRCEAVLSRSLAGRLRGVIGIVRNRGGRLTIESRRKGH